MRYVYATSRCSPGTACCRRRRALGQKFLLSMTLRRPLRRAALTGGLSLSVDYAEACAFATQFMQEHTYALIESAAEALAARAAGAL